MKSLHFAPEADRDLESIADFIAAENPTRAASFIAEIRSRCKILREFPQSARRLPELGPNARILTYKRYVILYEDLHDQVLITRIVHGARDLLAIIAEMQNTN